MIVGQAIPFEARTKLRIPMTSGSVQAGFPSPTDDHMEHSLDLNEHLVSNPADTFFVRVQGNSMKDSGIVNGDTLMVDRSVAPSRPADRHRHVGRGNSPLKDFGNEEDESF